MHTRARLVPARLPFFGRLLPLPQTGQVVWRGSHHATWKLSNDQRSAGKYALISHPHAISTIFGVRHCIAASSAVLRTPGHPYLGEARAHCQPLLRLLRSPLHAPRSCRSIRRQRVRRGLDPLLRGVQRPGKRGHGEDLDDFPACLRSARQRWLEGRFARRPIRGISAPADPRQRRSGLGGGTALAWRQALLRTSARSAEPNRSCPPGCPLRAETAPVLSGAVRGGAASRRRPRACAAPVGTGRGSRA